MFEKFTEESIRLVMMAQEESRRMGHNYVGTEQFFLGILHSETSIASRVLKDLGVTLKNARESVEKFIGHGSGFVAIEIPFTPVAKQVFEKALDKARYFEHKYITPEHILLAILDCNDCVAQKVLNDLSIIIEQLRAEIISNMFKRREPLKTHIYTIAQQKKSKEANALEERFKAIEEQIKNMNLNKSSQTEEENCIFIGHGRNKIWARVNSFLGDEMKLKTEYFERNSQTGKSVITALESCLEKATFAVIIMTAEDETNQGTQRARQNVIHEIGLFQGKLGFDKVAILLQDGVEEFSNIAGLQYIPFTSDKIEQTFYELEKMLERERIIEARHIAK